MKRMLALILAAVMMAAALTGCAGNVSTTDNGRVNGTNDNNTGKFYPDTGADDVMDDMDGHRSDNRSNRNYGTDYDTDYNGDSRGNANRNTGKSGANDSSRSKSTTRPSGSQPSAR